MVEINLTPLLKEQFSLDKTIQDNHHISYEQTKDQRLLALLVELGEFANTTRCFKFWSNKGLDTKERILDEAADCLHFYLSLKISDDLKALDSPQIVKLDEIKEKRDNQQLTLYFNEAISSASFKKNYDESFINFLQIIYGLGYSWSDLVEAYYKKLEVNYNRQKNNY